MQAAEDNIREHVADRVARCYRPWPLHIENAAFRRADGDRSERARVIWNVRRHQAFDAECGVGEAIIVDDVDAITRCWRRAVEIDMDALFGDRQGGIEHERLIIAVHGQAVAIGAMRQSAYPGERRLARCVDDCLAKPIKIGNLEFVHHLDQSPAALVIARRARVDVAHNLQRFAHIGAHEVQQILVHAALAGERHDWNGEALFEHLPAVRSHAEAADIHDMDRVGEQADRFAAVEARRHDRDVMQMARGQPGIVDDEVVAGFHAGERMYVEKMPHRIGHRIDMPRGAGDGLSQHAALSIEYAGRKIAGLANGGAECRAEHRLRLLLDNRDQPAPHDLLVDQSKRGIGSCNHISTFATTKLNITEPVDPRVEVWTYDCRSLVFGDHCRAFDVGTGCKVRPPIDRHVREFARARVKDGPAQLRFRITRSFHGGCGETALLRAAQLDDPAQNLDLNTGDRAAVEPAIGRFEQLGNLRSICGVELAYRKLYCDLMALAAVAHES